ncbi:MAG TPA: SusC/RagA family TonB-linked outer membrane protein [Phnomibacter sp.]|nr:SusC/RagA family TonB-linked outer membrane protein [Phnomibacter sp.]
MNRIYRKVFCVLSAAALFSSVTLQAQENKDSLVNVAFGTVAKDDLLGGISTVNISELINKSYGVYSLDNLQSLVGGYTGNGNVWGQAALILVDGIPRSASEVRLVEIESITILKGASAVVLYGSNAAKGVILITTKRGSVKPLDINVRANTGVFVPKSFPGYLNAASYMTMYNEALTNDGLSTVGAGYTQGSIDSTIMGKYGYKYADIDYFSSEYLKKAFFRSDITTEISGGNDRAKYYSNIGMLYNNNLVNYGGQKDNSDFAFKIRGNVDMRLNSWLTAATDIVANVSNNYTGRGNFWGESSTVNANFNRFTPLIPIDYFNPNKSSLQTTLENSNHVIDGESLLGGQSTNLTNAFSDMLTKGYAKNKSRTFLFNVGVNANLNSLTKGLSFKAGFSMDYASLFAETYQVAYAVYRPVWVQTNGIDMIDSLIKFNNDLNTTNESITRTTYTQMMSLRSQFDYDRSFAGKHNISGTLLGWWYMSQFSSDANNDGGSTYQPVRNSNLGFRAGYNFKQKYYFDFSSALVHSAKLPEENRNAFSPTVTMGWRISNEEFFKNNVNFIDNLKIVGSYASLNQDLDITGVQPDNTTRTDYYLYQSYFGNSGSLSGWYPWRDGSSGGFTTLSGRGGNPNLTFVKRNEIRAGIEASLFKSLITLDANYFYQKTNGLLTRGNVVFPSYFTGSGDFRPWLNYNNDQRTGMDFSVNLNNNIGKLKYSLGLNGMFYSSKALQRDEIQPESYMYRKDRPLDVAFGYISEGFFNDQAEISSHATQTFGEAVKPGDIKYKDVNQDGIIDFKDQVDLGVFGWSASPFNYGINLTLQWKNFTLFSMANGQTGSVGFKNSSYYWVRGSSKFSEEVLGRWTEATKDIATFPRLTTGNGNNNYQNSTFWMYKNNRFNLSRVQLSYNFNDEIFKNSVVHSLSLYVLGDNLLVISKERKLMETNIGTAPQYRFYNLGIRASF